MRAFLLIAALGLTLAGCNTIDGVGRDISGGAQRMGQMF